MLGNSRNSPVWHTVHAEDGTSTRKQPLRRNWWRRRGRVGSPLSTSFHGYCLGKADQREDSTARLRDTKPLNSGKRSWPPRDTRGNGCCCVLIRRRVGKVDQHSHAGGERRTRRKRVWGGGTTGPRPGQALRHVRQAQSRSSVVRPQ